MNVPGSSHFVQDPASMPLDEATRRHGAARRSTIFMSKVAFIGAGSVEFTRNIVSDLLSLPGLAGLRLALHDIDAKRLDTAVAVARRIREHAGGELEIELHRDRRAALDGAAYVINEIQVGGLEATRSDFEIPARFGVRQTIADTLGVGGIFRGLRTIPVMLDIAGEMAELCPDAWLLSYTNPMAMLPWSVYAGTPVRKVVGLCHSVRDTHAFLAELVGVPVAEAAMVTAGLNHQAFVLVFEHEGESLYPRLDAAIARDPELARRVRIELYRRLGFFPTESSEHSAEYVPWFLRHDELIERFRIPVGEYIRRSEENLDEYEAVKRVLADGGAIAPTPTSELASEVIHSIETGERRVVYGNVENAGLIENLPPDCCVEVPCVVDRAGVQPVRVGRLPTQLAALNRTFVNVAELTVRAVLEGRRDHVYHAAMLDPNTSATLTLEDIRALCDELIAAHGDLLPPAIRS
jgi:alpha-galactosidase